MVPIRLWVNDTLGNLEKNHPAWVGLRLISSRMCESRNPRIKLAQTRSDAMPRPDIQLTDSRLQFFLGRLEFSRNSPSHSFPEGGKTLSRCETLQPLQMPRPR